MGNTFRRKAQFVSDEHKTKTPAAMNYSLVVSRDSVWIALPIAALDYLDILACDIHNSYITADRRERLWVIARPKFVSEARQNMLVRKALYVLKISDAAFRAFLAETLDAMGYRPSYTNTDLWLRPSVKPDVLEY